MKYLYLLILAALLIGSASCQLGDRSKVKDCILEPFYLLPEFKGFKKSEIDTIVVKNYDEAGNLVFSRLFDTSVSRPSGEYFLVAHISGSDTFYQPNIYPSQLIFSHKFTFEIPSIGRIDKVDIFYEPARKERLVWDKYKPEPDCYRRILWYKLNDSVYKANSLFGATATILFER